MQNSMNLDSKVQYTGNEGNVNWEGRIVENVETFKRYMRNVVSLRVSDAESSFESVLNALATTGMETTFVERLLNSVPAFKHWEIGEALAECALVDDCGHRIVWPWNTLRDRRSPRASLPGADLVGFYFKEENVFLVFGEVKTSSDLNSPPRVMSGGSGMAWQLQENAFRLDIHCSLLKWLQSRCQSGPNREHFRKATTRYLKSEGKDLLIVGVLIRDTTPNELDLIDRGKELSNNVQMPTRVELVAWYVPVHTSDWAPMFLEAGS